MTNSSKRPEKDAKPAWAGPTKGLDPLRPLGPRTAFPTFGEPVSEAEALADRRPPRVDGDLTPLLGRTLKPLGAPPGRKEDPQG
jgi:hypothetical protein